MLSSMTALLHMSRISKSKGDDVRRRIFPPCHRALQGGKEDRFLFTLVIQQELWVSQLNFLFACISLQDIMSSKDLSSAYLDDRIGGMSWDSVIASTQPDSGVTATKVTSHIRGSSPSGRLACSTAAYWEMLYTKYSRWWMSRQTEWGKPGHDAQTDHSQAAIFFFATWTELGAFLGSAGFDTQRPWCSSPCICLIACAAIGWGTGKILLFLLYSA